MPPRHDEVRLIRSLAEQVAAHTSLSRADAETAIRALLALTGDSDLVAALARDTVRCQGEFGCSGTAPGVSRSSRKYALKAAFPLSPDF